MIRTAIVLIATFFGFDVAAQSASCPAPRVVDIHGGGADWRQLLTRALQCEQTEVRLGPDVDMSFEGVKWSVEGDPPEAQFPLSVAKCVTLRSVSEFDYPSPTTAPLFTCGIPEGAPTDAGVILGPGGSSAPASTDTAGVDASASERNFIPGEAAPDDLDELTVEPLREVGSARTPRSRGPVLRFGGNHARLEVSDEDSSKTFIEIRCFPEHNALNDGIRISGFRLEGPRRTDLTGVRVDKCIDIEVSNMEIDGWDYGVSIVDDAVPEGEILEVDQGRIRAFGDIRIYNSYFHNNEHASSDGHAGGYGVVVGNGSWARISESVFDSNRHAIAASGNAGGYDARRNLVLKGGGFHTNTVIGAVYTHQFDAHGTHSCKARTIGLLTLGVIVIVGAVLAVSGVGLGVIAIVAGVLVAMGGVAYVQAGNTAYNCGYAGFDFRYDENAIQYDSGDAIKIRGLPRKGAEFAGNFLPHDELFAVRGLTGDIGDFFDRVGIQLTAGANITIFDDNKENTDTFGEYDICDFDGDGVDDQFLATGATWWYSSGGRFHWSYMNAKRQRLANLKLGYFDGDLRCDVLASSADGTWLYVSGGYGDWQPLGDQSSTKFGAGTDTETVVPLAEIAFGRFNPDEKDFRTGLPTRRITHALRRRPDSQWEVTALDWPRWSTTDPQTRSYASSGFDWDQLRFGDFTGDGVTDVLAVTGGQWQISESAQGQWSELNALDDDVSNLLVRNLDADDNIDDVLRLDNSPLGGGWVECTWMRSKNGAGPWEPLQKQSLEFPSGGTLSPGCRGFAGRFNSTPATGGAVMLIDSGRLGRFVRADDASSSSSNFPY